ncbi:hypothetical protein [Paracidovorax avenae]|uniref:hypothetical protein n=1 Tax=Paracidovorax avenae TaxID=80867 RepID=UPI000D225D38|nr:hypothetical protein [Paracidovorax avenae]AVS97072.1 hypothetical protein C8232_13100 [Paracidovorax avenae]AVT04203.1 hypothetical protein C8243_18165 [Paracidovorax avenae]AVT07649.1 hypothetical protein C8248_18005 [Paracidovorax avenae]AVT11056.1 hypothetical protein C8242_17365 [Paracidovorax avenae]
MPVDAAAVAKLQQACDKAAALYPNSCSHSVWYVIQQYLPDQPWMNANALMDHVQGQRHWRSVPASQVGELARGGALIVGGKKETGHGHVIVVYPGPDKAAGGYSYTRGGKTETLRTRGSYPPVMSTSLGGWPGARSKGDKTIWDPWASDAKFAHVTFWQLVQ